MTRIETEQGILSDIEILERLVSTKPAKMIFVSPLVNPSQQLGPSSLDLRLGTELTITRNFASSHIDLTLSKEEVERQAKSYYAQWKIAPSDSFVLHPGQFALAPTLEWIKLPRDIAGRLEGRSTIGRLGLQVHATAGFIDPGFEGTLTFELINSGNLPVRLPPGYRLGQICFFRVLDVQVDYMHKPGRKYARKPGSERSRPEEDFEVQHRKSNEIVIDLFSPNQKVVSDFLSAEPPTNCKVSIFREPSRAAVLGEQVISIGLMVVAGISASLIANWIFSKLTQGKVRKITINRREVEIKKGDILRIVESTINFEE